MNAKRKILRCWADQPEQYRHWYLLWAQTNGRVTNQMLYALSAIVYSIERKRALTRQFDPVYDYYRHPIRTIIQTQGRYVTLHD